MADTTFRFRVDDSNVEQVMAGIADQIERTDQEYLQLEKDATEALQAIADNTAKTSRKLDEYAGQVEKTAKKTKEAEQETGRFGKGLKTLFGNLSLGGVSINDLSDSLGTLKGGLKDVSESSRTAGADAANVGKGFGVLKLGLVGVAVVVGATLVAAFTRFSKNSDLLRSKVAGLKAGFGEVVTVAGVYGNKLLEVIRGNKGLRDALQEAKKETKGWTDELKKAVDQAERLEQRQIKLERQTQLFNATYKFQRGELEKLSILAEKNNDLQSNTKRQKISQNLDKESIRLAEERLGILLNQNNATEKGVKNVRSVVQAVKDGRFIGDDEGLQKFIESLRGIKEGTGAALTTQVLAAVEEYGDLTETITEQQSEIQSQRQSIIAANEQARKDREAALATALKRAQELVSLTVDAESKIGGAGRVAAQEFANATDEIIKLQEEYAVLAKQLGTGETEADIEALFQPLKDIAAIDFEKASFGQSLEAVTGGLDRLIKLATDPLTEDIADLVSSQTATPLKDRLRRDGLEAGKALSAAIVQGQSLEAARQQERGNEAAKQLIGQLAPEAINAFFEAEQARFELRIAQQDALIGKINERLEVEKKALEEQQKLADEGFANDLNGAKKRVAEQERLLRDSENKKLEIERKAANQRKIIAAGQQAVELTLAVAKLISAEASKGLIGLVLAVGGLAIISRLVAAGRSQAASEAGRTQNFATGTERVRGDGTWTSDSVPVNLSKDERVIKSSDNARLGFERMSNKQLVHYALLGQRVHSDPLFAFAMGLRGQQSKLEESKLSLQVDVMKDAYKEAALMAADKQIDYWRTRPIQYQNEAGEMVTEWKEGNRVVRQIEV
jgi:hypothetical protein